MPEPRDKDWTQGPARFVAACALGLAGLGGLAWSIMNPAPPRTGELPPGLPAAPVARVSSDKAGSSGGAGSSGDASVVRRREEAGVEAGLAADRGVGGPHDATGAERPPASQPTLARVIDVNSATAAQLEQLPRIGPTLAQRIVEDREANGPFASVDDLTRVRGIGEKTVDGLRGLAAAR